MKNQQYKIIVNNKMIHREFLLTGDIQIIKLGTTMECVFRLNPNLFMKQFELEIMQTHGHWNISCDENVYLSNGTLVRLVDTELEHGSQYFLMYGDTGEKFLEIGFFIDFESEIPNYNRKIAISHKEYLSIGAHADNDLILISDYAANNQIELFQRENKFGVREIKTEHGLYINGTRMNGETLLKDYDFFYVADCSFFYKNEELYFDKDKVSAEKLEEILILESTSGLKYPKFNRNTRIKKAENLEAINILKPVSKPKKPKSNVAMSLMPAILMLALTIFLRCFVSGNTGTYIILSVCSMGMGIITSVISIFSERKRYKEECLKRESQYQSYIESKKIEISKARMEELDYLQKIYFNLEKDKEIVKQFSGNLFERTPQDKDFLKAYLGKGSVEAERKVEFAKNEKFDAEDDMERIPEEIAATYSHLESAPVVADFRTSNVVGIVGKDGNRYEFFKNLILDMAVRHYYGEVKFYLFLGDNTEKYMWLRFLPHLENENGMRNIAYDNNSKNQVFENLYKELMIREEKKNIEDYLVIFVLEEQGIKSHPLSRFLSKASELNATFVFFESQKEFLPLYCTQIISLKDEKNGELILTEDGGKKQKFEYEHLTDEEAMDMVVKMAPVYCEEISLESSLRKNISLYELMHIYSAEDLDLNVRWEKSKVEKSIAVPLGINAKNEIVYLDLHEKAHGPHGLVAGTTGSGKSEILQSFILSAATLFHPYEIGFVIIDFKGGGMVNQFRDLPHLIGAITNIDGKEIQRSLLSIKAELRKRQELFATYNVNHIDAYIQKYKKQETSIPLPHLILIVDEFAELKMEQPEFMKELISAARIGRSLGVHLILATQKPSGVVDAQIWSNSKFRLCLKVQNKEDSNEVLKTPLASEIREPGRAYIQVGNNEIFELFQSAYSGGAAALDLDGSQKKYEFFQVDFSGKRTSIFKKETRSNAEQSATELEELVQHINAFCMEQQITRLPGICLPPLSDMIKYTGQKSEKNPLSCNIEIGIYDDPYHQLQELVSLDISEGNTIVIGASQTGKTTFIQTMIRGIAESYSPQEVSVYILDFASKALTVFETLNHVGGIITPAEDEKMKHLIKMLRMEVVIRKERFANIGITSFKSYKEAGYQDFAHLLIVIDNFAILKELYSTYEDDILYLCREGLTVGISFVVTAMQVSSMGYKYLSNFNNRISYYCNDKGEYSNIFERCKIEPENTPGRGLIWKDKEIYEFQTYLPFEGEKEIDRVEKIKDFIKDTRVHFGECEAIKIPEVPKILTRKELEKRMVNRKILPYEVTIGMDYEEVSFVKMNLAKAGLISICGKDKNSKKNLIELLLGELQRRVFTEPSQVYMLDNYERELEEFAEAGIVKKHTIDMGDLDIFLDDIENELMARQELVKKQGLNILDKEPLLLLMIQNEEFLSANVDKKVIEKFKRIMKLGKMLKFCVILANVENAAIGFNSNEILKSLKENKKIFFVDNISNFKLFDLGNAVLKRYKKTIEQGDCYYISEEGVIKLKTVSGER